MKRKENVLILCTGNSCRSQIAEAFLRHMADDRYNVYSAGMNPQDEVNPLAVEVMAEIGIDISAQKPKSVKDFLGKQFIQWLLIVCNKANMTCPRVWPMLEDQKRLYWPFHDPAEATGTHEEQLAVFRKVRDQIRDKLTEWLAEQAEE